MVFRPQTRKLSYLGSVATTKKMQWAVHSWQQVKSGTFSLLTAYRLLLTAYLSEHN